MYYPYFIAYIAIGLVLSLAVFFWALKSGQFRDQQRVRFLPLRDEKEVSPVRVSRFNRVEIYTLFILVSAGLLASAALLIYALRYRV
jgi:cbb3-type cytochrome oxidase maturation protein